MAQEANEKGEKKESKDIPKSARDKELEDYVNEYNVSACVIHFIHVKHFIQVNCMYVYVRVCRRKTGQSL